MPQVGVPGSVRSAAAAAPARKKKRRARAHGRHAMIGTFHDHVRSFVHSGHALMPPGRPTLEQRVDSASAACHQHRALPPPPCTLRPRTALRSQPGCRRACAANRRARRGQTGMRGSARPAVVLPAVASSNPASDLPTKTPHTPASVGSGRGARLSAPRAPLPPAAPDARPATGRVSRARDPRPHAARLGCAPSAASCEERDAESQKMVTPVFFTISFKLGVFSLETTSFGLT